MKDTRDQIDGIDKEIISLLVKRQELSLKIGKQKAKKDIFVRDRRRETEILENLSNIAKEKGVSPTLIKKIYIEILKESRRIQRNK